MNLELNTIYNENCFDTMERMTAGRCNVVLTSPFYNTNKKQCKNNTLDKTSSKTGFPFVRYDTHIDNMTDEEYNEFTVKLFQQFDRVLAENGVVLYNISYGNNNRVGMFKAVNAVIERTNFTIADVITWKKSAAMPNNCSKNKLTRITEFIFVFCRCDEINTFHCNKEVTSIRKTGQKSYSSIFNYIEARNNDGSCPYNKATFSSDLCKKLLKIYAPDNGVIYDPFIGTGTTAVACKDMGLFYIGSEISKKQCEWAEERLEAATNE